MSELPQFPGCTCHDLIAEGSCGTVYAGLWEEDTPVAVKIFKPEAINAAYVKQCLDRLRKAAPHPGILPIYDYDLDGDPAYCVMALRLDSRQQPSEPQTLEGICGQVSLQEGWILATQLAAAMAEAHHLDITHCGLKTSNVFLYDDGESVEVQVSDFAQGWLGGVERLALNDHTFYASPEQLAHPEQLFERDVKTWDVYAYGAVVYRLLTGYFARFENELEELRRTVEANPEAPIVFNPAEYSAKAVNYPEILWPDAPEDSLESERRRIVERCLEIDPGERFPDMAAVMEDLKNVGSHSAIQSAASVITDAGASAAETATATATNAQMPRPVQSGADQPREVALMSAPVSPMRRLFLVVPWLLAIAFAVVAGLLYQSYTEARNEAEDLTGELILEKGRLKEFTGELANQEEQQQKNANLVEESTLEAGAAREEKIRAQRNLSKAQDIADFFFTEFVETGSGLADTPERKFAFQRAEKFYHDVLAAANGDSALLDSVARATLNLALIQSGLGKIDEAEEGFTKAIEAFTQLSAADPESPASKNYQLRLAKALSAAAKLRVARGDYEAGNALLEQAIDVYRSFADRLPNDPVLNHSVADVYHCAGESLRHLDRIDEAIAQQARVIELISHAEENPNNAPTDALLLSKAYFERGRSRLAKQELDLGASNDARQQMLDAGANDHIKAVDMLLELNDLDAESATYRYQLGRNYWALGEVLAERGIWTEAGRAHSEAVKYLKGLVEQFPDVSDYKFGLARDYAAVARLQRDRGKPESALEYQRGTVVFINEVVSKAGATDLQRHELAQHRGIYAQLLITAERQSEALGEARQAVTLLEEIAVKQAAGSHLRTKFQISLAQMYGTLGDVAESGEEKDEAVSSFKKAVSTWQQLVNSGVEDEAVQKGLEWSKQRLTALDPTAVESGSEESADPSVPEE